MPLTVQGYFCRIFALTNTWALMIRRTLQNPPKITLHGICHSLAPIGAKRFPEVPFFKKWAKRSLSIICFFLKKWLVVVIYEVEVKTEVL